MKDNMDKKRLFDIVDKVGNKVYEKLTELKIEGWITKEPLKWDKKTGGEYRLLNIGESWGGLFDCAWFKLTGIVPEYNQQLSPVLLIDIGGEGLVFDDTGKVVRGLTNKKSSYGIPPDKPGKWVVELDNYAPGAEITFWVDAGCNDLIGYVQNGGIITDAYIGTCNDEMKQLYYDLEVITDWLKGDGEYGSNQPKGAHSIDDKVELISNERMERFYKVLQEADEVLKNYTNDEIKKARKILGQELNKKSENNSLEISAVGHAHLDIAWMWPIREGRRKAARTFATAVKNMEIYPDYIFGASQYQLFDWIKEDHPDLFEKIKKYVAEGRFELQGCSWVEADLNLSGGEALIRQVLYGLKFLREEFGEAVNNLWEPDVFGFTGALPQILVKSGIEFIGSQKLSQNAINKFPHHLFKWKGIDGSELIMHNFPEDTYDGRARATSSIKLEANYIEKEIAPKALMVYGVGDGGGGPGEEHLERIKRIRNIEGLPKIKNQRASDFFEDIREYADNLPVITGELYFERHQGTFTSESYNKKMNRKMEYALREAEYYSLVANMLHGYQYPQEGLEKIWKEVLTLQFHDILPGSSIARVHKESKESYDKLMENCNFLVETALSKLEENIDTSEYKNPYIAYNSLNWDRKEWIKIDGKWNFVESPQMGYSIFECQAEDINKDLKASKYILENKKIRVLFNENGGITSIYNTELDYEFIDENQTGNIFTIYHERADQYPAWDFAEGYRDGEQGKPELVKVHAKIDGPKAIVVQEYRYKKSAILIEISLTSNSSRIDFDTKINWMETDTSVKTKFPITVKAKEAICDIQFGNIARPTHNKTSFDLAKDEIPAHKWVDVSNGEVGISIITDCKYGYRVKDQALEISILRSQIKPGAQILAEDHPDYIENHFGDIGEQSFTYSIYTHRGDHIEGKVNQEGYNLNVPLKIRKLGVQEGMSKSKNSFFSINNNEVVIETIKKAENGDEIIVRLYESSGKVNTFELLSDKEFKKIWICNLMEEKEIEICKSLKNLTFDIAPFEIVTLKLQIKE